MHKKKSSIIYGLVINFIPYCHLSTRVPSTCSEETTHIGEYHRGHLLYFLKVILCLAFLNILFLFLNLLICINN